MLDVFVHVLHNLTHVPLREFYDKKKGDRRRLLKTLWHLAAPTFVPAGFCQLITVFAQVAIPVLVRELLRILEENPSAKVIKQGMPFAILIFVAALINAFGTHRHLYLATITGVVLRASLVNAIYDNALHLTPEGCAGLTSGQVTTLVAVDTQKVRSILLDEL
jgi:ABC-type multidrug transport system fused ATPase/permease subunit